MPNNDTNLLSKVLGLFPSAPQSCHLLRRNGRLLLGIPCDRAAAGHTLRLYQPQRRIGRLVALAVSGLIRLGLHHRLMPVFQGGDHQKSITPPMPGIGRDSCGVMLGSPDHRVRRAVASFKTDEGWEVAKIAFGTEGVRMIEKEAALLSNLQSKVRGIPKLLDLHRGEDVAVLRMPYLLGKPFGAGRTGEALELLTEWETRLPAIPITDFPEWKYISQALSGSTAGRNALGQMSGQKLRPVIRHGDFARWNLLKQADGNLVVLDWEWGAENGMPGLDLVHYHAQDASLVQRMDSAQAIRTVEDALAEGTAKSYLARNGWEGHPIMPILACLAYKHGARHQKQDRLFAACLARFAREFQPPGTNTRSAGRLGISIVTPSFHQLKHLKRCAASVADQSGDFEVEHLIHDAESGPGFDEWAAAQHFASCVSEKDQGMYDAINRGFRRTKGEIIAWLNCDEQYLPGALQLVAEFFEQNPDVDILFGDVILVDESMKPLAYRRAVRPTIGHIRHSHLSTFSAATFVRRKVLDEGHYLDIRWKTIADAVWIEELLSTGYRGVTFGKPLATFAMLGSNLGQSSALFDERRQWEIELGATTPWRKKAYIWQYRISKLLSGAYLPRRCRVESYQSETGPRTAHTRWLWGFWNQARKQASQQKIDSEGSFSMRRSRRQFSTTEALSYAAIAIVLGHFSDLISTGESVKAPLVMIFALMLLSLRAKGRDIIIISVIFLAASAYALRFRPLDVAIVRILTFAIGAVLSYLLTVSFRDVEEWMLITIGLIRRVPQPVVLTDSYGKIVLVNAKAEQLLETEEKELLGRNLSEMISGGTDISTWQDRPPGSLERIEFNTGGTLLPLPARVFMVGNGKRRLFGFSLGDA